MDGLIQKLKHAWSDLVNSAFVKQADHGTKSSMEFSNLMNRHLLHRNDIQYGNLIRHLYRADMLGFKQYLKTSGQIYFALILDGNLVLEFLKISNIRMSWSNNERKYIMTFMTPPPVILADTISADDEFDKKLQENQKYLDSFTKRPRWGDLDI